LALLCWAWSGLAYAGGADDAAGKKREPAEYRALVDHAVQEFELHNFAEARALFSRAHTLFPNARTLRALGMVEFELKNYVDSATWLAEALASQLRPLEGKARSQTEELLGRAHSFVARVELSILPRGAAVSVKVDGTLTPLAADSSLALLVGDHVLSVQMPGYREETVRVSVKGAEVQRVELQLRAHETLPAQAAAASLQQQQAPAASAPAQATSPPHDLERRPVYKSPWLWTGVGAVVVGAVLTGVLLSTRAEPSSDPIPGDVGGVVQVLRDARR
jgi:tetratricopeptide (TPR) repeat protein